MERINAKEHLERWDSGKIFNR